MATDLVIATTNAGKFREFVSLLAGVPVTLKSLADFPGAPEVEETGDTYAENAAKKAIAIARWSGHVALADDSGLEVDALDGAPGVRSARYAGIEQDPNANIDKLLHALQGVPTAQRTARFRCVIAVAGADGAVLTVEGSCEGRILEAKRGAGGFGYDPVFFYPPAGRSFAELAAPAKHEVSHRARACEALRPRLLSFLEAAVSR
jgi:XTP/dITP diphosphohydrolase